MALLVDVRDYGKCQRTFSSGARVTSFVSIGIGDEEMPQRLRVLLLLQMTRFQSQHSHGLTAHDFIYKGSDTLFWPV